ncbi:uncharacterized protein [Miscanthus floridulus]|uniref:uncharacterized protein n=1 Tax=Miscanthus floridulus TaxID=154761 RepID=UPI00345AC5C3
MDTEATPLSPPPPLRMRFAVVKRLPPRSSRKRPTDDLPLAPLKALKASPGSFAHWVAEAQAALHRGTASARVDLKEPAAQGGATEVDPTPTREGALPSRGGEAHKSDGAGVPVVAEAPGVSEAKATEDRAPKTAETAVAAAGVSASFEAKMAEAGALEAVEAIMAEAGAPEITKAVVMAAGPFVQVAEIKAVEASVAPLAQGSPLLRESAREVEVYPISFDDTSRAWEAVNAEDADDVEQPAPILDEGSSALELETRSLKKLVFLRRERGIWDQLQRQKGLLADANELLSAQSAEMEDLRLRCADAKVEVATAQTQLAPLAARVKELEEELTRTVSDQDAFRGQDEAGGVGAEQRHAALAGVAAERDVDERGGGLAAGLRPPVRAVQRPVLRGRAPAQRRRGLRARTAEHLARRGRALAQRGEARAAEQSTGTSYTG